MATHTVTWTIDLEAESHKDAVQQAHDMCRDPKSIVTYYRSTLIARPSDSVMIDVLHLEDEDDTEHNTPCIICGDKETPLHVSGRCGNCGPGPTDY